MKWQIWYKFDEENINFYDCYYIQYGKKRRITPEECQQYINKREAKCYGSNDKGYIIYGN